MLDRFLNRLVSWEPWRFWTYTAIAVLIAMEATSWITAEIGPSSSCLVDVKSYGEYYAQHNECPTFHVFFIVTMTGVLKTIGHQWLTALATAAIATLTFAIVHINRSQLTRTEDIERAYMSAGGARQPPRPLTLEERTRSNLGPPPPGTDYFMASEWFQFDINNHGKTKGEILEYGYGWCEVNEVNNLPERPQYRWVRFRDQIGPGTQSRGIKRIRIPADRPVIFGRIGYEDIFGRRHSHGFIQNLGVPIAPPHHSYIETDPSWDVPLVGRRNYQEEEPQN